MVHRAEMEFGCTNHVFSGGGLDESEMIDVAQTVREPEGLKFTGDSGENDLRFRCQGLHDLPGHFGFPSFFGEISPRQGVYASTDSIFDGRKITRMGMSADEDGGILESAGTLGPCSIHLSGLYSESLMEEAKR